MSVLAAKLGGIRYDALPDRVVAAAKNMILDNLGCALLGAESGEPARINRALADDSPVSARVLGARTGPFAATVANATAICLTELAEGVGKAVVHPGTVVVPAVLAAAEWTKADGRTAIAATVAGYEALITIGWAAARPAGAAWDDSRGLSLHRGWYPPALLGGFGTAAAVAHLLGATEPQIDASLGTYANLAPTSMLAASQQGSMAKPLSAGLAAAWGGYGATLAVRGFTGLDDPTGHLLPLLVPGCDAEGVLERVSPGYQIEELDVKFFAVAGPMRTDLECAYQLRARHAFQPADVRHVLVETNERAALLHLTGPRNPGAARFSLRYCVAHALCTGDRAAMTTGDAFTADELDRADVARLADRIDVVVEPEINAAYNEHGARRPSRLTVTLHDGQVFTHRVEGMKGLRMSPATDDDFAEKFRLLAGRSLPPSRVDEIQRTVAGLEALGDCGELGDLLLLP
ncbi:MAG: hypothetical protein GEV12_00250 [Micromonosporaceae bacterium]|nr:hypothetical protein [Micromonosporaceae bacterium]